MNFLHNIFIKTRTTCVAITTGLANYRIQHLCPLLRSPPTKKNKCDRSHSHRSLSQSLTPASHTHFTEFIFIYSIDLLFFVCLSKICREPRRRQSVSVDGCIVIHSLCFFGFFLSSSVCLDDSSFDNTSTEYSHVLVYSCAHSLFTDVSTTWVNSNRANLNFPKWKWEMGKSKKCHLRSTNKQLLLIYHTHTRGPPIDWCILVISYTRQHLNKIE